MVWKDLSDSSFKIGPRVNASFTAVPEGYADLEEVSSSGPPSDGQLFLFGGDDGKNPLQDIWLYELVTGVWEEPSYKGELPTARSNAGGKQSQTSRLLKSMSSIAHSDPS